MRLFLLMAALWAFPAMAQERMPAACKLIPDANNVVYKPGIDVDGNAVVPADLNSNPMGGMLNIIKVPLEFDLAQRISGLNIDGVNMESSLGMIEIHQNGKIMYNDQDITKPVMTLCAKSHKEVSVEVIEAIAPVAPQAPELKAPLPQAPTIEIPNNLAVTKEQAIERPSVSEPAEPKLPLIGTPKATPQVAQSDILQGQDHRNYNE